MIRVFDWEVPCDKRFPDGTSALRIPDNLISKIESPTCRMPVIEWYYENDAEFLQVAYLTGWLKAHNVFRKVQLFMPYIPNARNDRVQNEGDVFTLRYFCDLINSLNFDMVRVLDPHSFVVCGMIERLYVYTPAIHIACAIDTIEEKTGEQVAVFYPDEGSMKRYTNLWKDYNPDYNRPYAFGVKKRDWNTGNIQGLQLLQEENIVGKNVLIIDDICSRGGTFYHSAKALKEAGAKGIYLWVTHCENTILDGDLINMPEVLQVFTTDSILTKEHPKIVKMTTKYWR